MQAVIATFDDPQTARAAVDSLIAEGFMRESVHLEAASQVSGSLSHAGTRRCEAR